MMLAGNHIECGDEVYSYADLPSLRQQPDRSSASESKQSATSKISQPLRSSQTRRALRIREGSVHIDGKQGYYSSIYDTMGNVESDEGNPVSYHAGAYNTHVGQFITGTSGCDGHLVAQSVHQNSTTTTDSKVTEPKADKVQLGDYTFPPDQRKESIEGIKSPNPTEYCDPYETENLSKLKGSHFTHNAEGLRRSLPTTLDDHSDIYELASAIPDSKNSVPTGKGPHSARNTRLQSEGSQTYHSPLTRCVSEPVPQEEPDEYDHLSTWKDKTGRNITDSRLSDRRWCDNSGESMMATIGAPGGDRKDTNEQVYAGAYEEPWDTRKKKQQFSDITDRAQNLFDGSSGVKISSQPSDDITSDVKLRQKPKQEIAVYEDAWDTPENQRMFELHVKDVQIRESSKDLSVKNKFTPEQNEAYEEPWKATAFIRSPAAAPLPISPGHSAPQVLPGSATRERQGGDTYESPWDTKKMEEKVQQVSLQHSTTRTSAPSSPGSPPNFFAPKVPDDEYQEAWDTRPSSDIISRSTGGRRISTGRTDRSSTSREPAEKIDPSIPLDIQKFYHGGITRKQAEDLMTIHKEGSYLIRRSETQNNVFSLSLKGARGMPMHIRIGLKGGEYILGENSQPFPTVPEVIDYYTRHELPVQGAGRLRLLYPIMRDK